MFEGLTIGRDGWGLARVYWYQCPGDGDHMYYVAQWVPPIRALDDLPQDGVIEDKLLVLPDSWQSRSGIHFFRATNSVPVVARMVQTTTPTVDRLERSLSVTRIAEFTVDRPFCHERWLMAGDGFEKIERTDDTRMCARHYASALADQATLAQGHLYLRRVEPLGRPRIYSRRQPEVLLMLEGRIFNHRFEGIPRDRLLAREYSWGLLGSVVVLGSGAAVTSPEHDTIYLGSGEWEFYHPRPSRDGDD